MKQKFFSVKLYAEGIRQLKVVGVIFLIIATLINCISPLVALLVKAGVFDMESTVTEASALNMSQFTFMLVALAAIVMAFNLFKFLNKRSGSDFYHSLPVTRPCLFFSLCASVLTVMVLVFAAPILLAGLLYTIAGIKFLWGVSALCLLAYTLCALLLTACTLLGMSLTGTFISGFMMGLIVFLLPRILIMVYTSLLNDLTVIADVQALSIFTDPAYNLPVNLCLGLRRAGQGGVAAQVLIVQRLQSHHIKALAHAIAGNHGPGQLGGLLNVVGGAGGAGAKDHFLSSPAAGKSGDPVFQLFPGH